MRYDGLLFLEIKSSKSFRKQDITKNMQSHKVYNMLCSLCLQGHKYVYWQKLPGDPCQSRIIIHFLKIILRQPFLFILKINYFLLKP